ncbi:MAG: ATP-binding cassette domain-containing protein [Succinivibrio sp.]|nr:ATP-binding cassette domain-containing protein [Succinivibrio sp.]
MSIVTLMDASLAYGADSLLSGANLAIEEQERICLLGRNGTGKSTLLKVICREQELDAGRIIVQNGLKIARLMQDPPAYETGTAYSLAASGVPLVGEALSRYSLSEDVHEQQQLASVIESHDGWAKDAVIRRILSKLGLEPSLPLKELSGGFRRKAALAAVLACEPQLLMLDEPTNHLDIETIAWFEQCIRDFKGTVLFVTHDRAFADNLATRIVELDRGKLYSYPGSFNRYLELKAERLRMETLANQEFDRILAEEEAWIRRGVKARLARNEGRVRDLMEMRRQRSLRRDRLGNVVLKVNEAERSGNLVFEVRDVSLDYEGRELIRPFSATVMRKDRIGIVGPNGAGKTTLVSIILGKLKPSHGYVRVGMNVQAQYFDQYHEQLREDKTVAENVADGHSEVIINGRSTSVISYLANFLFTARRTRSPVSVLSGGEKNRLLLAKLFARPSNVLVLDEPTNDLDLETLDLLEDLIASYPGTVLVISHDRRFIDKVVTETWVFDGQGGIESVVGGWADVQAYYNRKAVNDRTQEEQSSKRPHTVRKKTALSFKENYELTHLPEEIEQLETKLSSLDEQLGDPQLYKEQGDKVRELLSCKAELEQTLEARYARWEELEEAKKRYEQN